MLNLGPSSSLTARLAPSIIRSLINFLQFLQWFAICGTPWQHPPETPTPSPGTPAHDSTVSSSSSQVVLSLFSVPPRFPVSGPGRERTGYLPRFSWFPSHIRAWAGSVPGISHVFHCAGRHTSPSTVQHSTQFRPALPYPDLVGVNTGYSPRFQLPRRRWCSSHVFTPSP